MAVNLTPSVTDDIALARRHLDALERELPNLRAHLDAAERAYLEGPDADPTPMHQAVRSARIVREVSYLAGAAVIDAAYGDDHPLGRPICPLR